VGSKTEHAVGTENTIRKGGRIEGIRFLEETGRRSSTFGD
jgi:hypothetical protein